MTGRKPMRYFVGNPVNPDEVDFKRWSFCTDHAKTIETWLDHSVQKIVTFTETSWLGYHWYRLTGRIIPLKKKVQRAP